MCRWLVSPHAALILISLIAVTMQQTSGDPLHPCERWLHQTCIVDNKLYTDGGLFYDGSSLTSQTPRRNTWLFWEDLSAQLPDGAALFPIQNDNLTKGSDVPTVSGGILWADNVNKLFYLYGGEYDLSSPNTFELWYFDTIYNSWNKSSPDVSQNTIVRAAHGAGTVVNDLGWAYYYGGYLSNQSVPGWGGTPAMLNSLVKYDMTTNTWTNTTYDTTPRAEGEMFYIPASDRGMLVYFGGVQETNKSAQEYVGMNQIFLFDIAAEKWYVQTAAGSIPPTRRAFSGGVVWAEDKSSYNIYIFGGFDQDENGLNDVYILSLPSFQWIEWWVDPDSSPGKGWTRSNVYGRSQMIVSGGYYSNTSYKECDVPANQGQHGLSLGQQNVENATWYQFLPNVTTYEVPANVSTVIGGGARGGATLKIPIDGWNNSDLATYFTRTYSPPSRTPTRLIPISVTATSTPTSGPRPNTGAIVGGAVGAALVLVGTFAGLLLCLRRRRSRRRQDKSASPQAGIIYEKDGVQVETSHYEDPNKGTLPYPPRVGMQPQQNTVSEEWYQVSPQGYQASHPNMAAFDLHREVAYTQSTGPTLMPLRQPHSPPPSSPWSLVEDAYRVRAELPTARSPVNLDGRSVYPRPQMYVT